MKLSTLVKFKEELKEIQAKGLKISEYCAVYNKNNSYFSNKIRLVKDSLNVYTSEAEEVISLYNSLLKRTSNKTEPSSLNGVTPNIINPLILRKLLFLIFHQFSLYKHLDNLVKLSFS